MQKHRKREVTAKNSQADKKMCCYCLSCTQKFITKKIRTHSAYSMCYNIKYSHGLLL